MDDGGRAAEFLRGARKSLPVITGMIPRGMIPSGAAFGILAETAGFSVWESLLMSLIVFAGASQFAALNLLAVGAPAADIVLATALLNARHIMMGSSLSRRMKGGGNPLCKAALFFFLTDESFSVASLQSGGAVSVPFLWGLQLPIYITWNVLTVCGWLGTSALPPALRASMGIAIYALFIALIIPSARKSRAALAVTLAAMALSTLFKFAPVLSELNKGVAIMISAGGAALLGALLFPPEKEETA